MADRSVTVFGGAGFIGRYLVKRLAEKGDQVRVAVRNPDRASFLKPMGEVGQIVPVQANIRDDRSVAAAVAGADAVVNLVGILYERGRQTFDAVHRDGAARTARAAAEAGATRFVQMSALGASARSPSAYARSKAAGEAAATEVFPGAAIVRPSIVFGPEDDFFNRFAALARLMPVLPVFGAWPPRLKLAGAGGPRIQPFGTGGTRFQPVYVGDVAEAFSRILDDPATAGRTYELGGPRVYSFKELMDLMLAEIGRRRLLLPLPFWVAELQAAVLQWLPVPPLTPDQVKLLRRDNVVGRKALKLEDLGITPTAVEVVVPTYLDRYRPGARFRGPGGGR
ncbi:MAG: complex I NDUFA9 subunit family protein [Kiloniellales bacterium]